MKVEYYRLWAGSSTDNGTWDTDYVDIEFDPDSEETPNQEIERALEDVVWKNGEAPLIVGFYAFVDEEEEEEEEEESLIVQKLRVIMKEHGLEESYEINRAMDYILNHPHW